MYKLACIIVITG